MPLQLDRPTVTRAVAGLAGLAGGGALFASGRESTIVTGVVASVPYCLIALGIALVFKATGVFNFAQGEFGTVAIFALYLARFWFPFIGYVGAMLFGILAAVAFGLLVERAVIRPLSEAPRVTLLVATAGIALLSIATQIWLGEAQARNVEKALTREDRFNLLGINISDQRILGMVVMVIVVVALAAFFNRTSLGLAVLASSQEPTATELCGISVKRVSALVWGVSGLLGGLAGVLAGPTGTFTPGSLTSVALVPGFTAAVLGGITSLPGAFVGGILISFIQALGTTTGSTIKGGPAFFTFLLLAGVLLVRPQGLFGGKR
jgi:branched-chain amino acid transport system permease protein